MAGEEVSASSRRQVLELVGTRRAALCAIAAAACVAVVLVVQDGDAGIELLDGRAKLDWNAFNQQLSHDWAGRELAMKEGDSAATLLHQKEEKEEKRRLVAQKRLEVKKIAEEKKIQSVERQIELEAGNQLASHDGQLSDAIVSSAPTPQVVMSGHFEPGFDAHSPGEAAAEMAAWGPNANAAWGRILSAERIQQKAARQRQQQQDRQPVIIHPVSEAQLPKVGETAGQIERQALAEVHHVEAAKQALLKNKAMAASTTHAASKTQVATEAAEGAGEARRAQAAAAEGAKLVKEAGIGTKPASAVKAAVEHHSRGGVKEKVSPMEKALERQLEEERAQNQALQRLLVSVSTQQRAVQAPPPPSPPPPPRAATEHGVLRCCDDSCETLSEHCEALAAPPPPQPATSPPVKPALTEAATGALDAASVAGLSKKELEGLLASGTAQEKALAAAALYDASKRHVSVGGGAAAKKQSRGARKRGGEEGARTVTAIKASAAKAEGEMVKGLRRCCDTACVRVSTECPHTHSLDQEAIHKVAQGKGPSASELQEWLISGTQAQKDKAAAILYAESQGKVTPPTPPKAAAHKASPPHAPASAAVTRPAATAGPPSAQSSFTSQTAIQSQNIAAEAEGIVGGLAAEGH